MTDRYKTLTALAVLLVAAIGAVISHQHVVALAIRYDAEGDQEIRRKTLGHADQAMTSRYTHIEAEAHRAAAEAIAALVEGAGS
jgi:integrase